MAAVRSGIAALALLAPALAAGPAGARPAAEPCTSSQLSGSFRSVPGSAGAGNVVYRLRLVNRTSRPCFVTGIPALTLLGKTGRRLPTHGSFSGSTGALTAVMVPLARGGAASLTARFSPDVPGPGEPTRGPCEQTAYSLRVVTSGGARVVVPVSSPTPVCEHGALEITVFTAA